MSTEESCCVVESRNERYLTSDGRQLDWEQSYCRICGAGAMRIEEGGLLLSFTTTGRKCKSLGGHGEGHASELISGEMSHPTPSDTPEQHGSCKPESTPGKPLGTSE